MHHLIRQQFNQASHTYDQQAYFQEKVGHHLISALSSHASKSNTIIDLGAGTGLVTQQLALTIAHQKIIALDYAPQLLNLAKKRLKNFHIHYALKNFDEPFDNQSVDLIFANLSLQWSQHLPKIFCSCQKILNTKGLLAFSVPLATSLPELKNHYAYYTLPELHHLQFILQENKFFTLYHEKQQLIYHFDNTLSALRFLKKTGTSFSNQKMNVLFGQRNYIASHPIKTLTYDIAYFILRKS